jgi:hypothetical protein
MAKSTTGKKDPQDTQTSERRRRLTGAAQNGADETATQPPQARRKPAATRRAVSDKNVLGQASAEPIDSPTVESWVKYVVDVPHEHIAVRAYHIYLERGGRAGDDFEDWITAERELRERVAGQRAR